MGRQIPIAGRHELLYNTAMKTSLDGVFNALSKGGLQMRKISVSELGTKDCKTIIEDINNCRYSILESIGCHRLRMEMAVPGFLSKWIGKFLFWKAGKSHNQFWDYRVKQELEKLFAWAAPSTIYGKPPKNLHGIIIGFNHPSLGEILRLIDFTVKFYPDSPMVFPVNLPWYEALCPIVEELKSAGVYLTPIITPTTLRKIFRVNPDADDKLINSIRGMFEAEYINLCREFSDHAVILVAPSATRQRTVFQSEAAANGEAKINPPTMSMIASMIGRRKDADCRFVPVSIKPPKGFGRGLNLFRRYELQVNGSITMEDARAMSRERYGGTEFRGHRFDFVFLKRLANGLRKLKAEELIYPKGLKEA